MIYTLIVAANLILGGHFASKLIKTFKEEGYVFPFNDKTTKEKIFEIVPFIVMALLPILNIATLVAVIVSLKKGDLQEKSYEIAKEVLLKTGIMMESVDSQVTNVDVKKPYDLEPKEEEVIRTHHDAASLWLQQHEEELREERSKHVCPTLDLGGSNNEEDLNQGYQKTMKR